MPTTTFAEHSWRGSIRYALKLRSGLRLFFDNGRIEIDTYGVERAIRPIALNRKAALFAGPDQAGFHLGYFADALTRLVNRHPARQIDQLMPWAYANQVA